MVDVAVVAIVGFLLNASPSTATGSSLSVVTAVSARNAGGIPTNRLTIALFMGSGLCAAFVGMSQAILYNSAQVAAGQSFIFNSIIAGGDRRRAADRRIRLGHVSIVLGTHGTS